MGKILVKGQAERQYEADICVIALTITTNHSDSSAATKEADKITEELLRAMENIGIEAERFCVTEDKTKIASHYDDMEGYISTRCLVLKTTPSMALVNDVRELIGSGFPKVAVSVSYAMSDEDQHRRELLQEAIRDSRDRADMMATAVGCKVIGLDTARLDDDDFDIDDIKDLTDSDNVLLCRSCEGEAGRIADRLQTEKVELNAEVNIVWLTD